MIGGYDELVPFITIFNWNDVNSFIFACENLYSLNVVSSSLGTIDTSGLPSVLNGVHATSDNWTSWSDPDVLKYISTSDVALMFAVNLMSNAFELFSNITGFVQ